MDEEFYKKMDEATYPWLTVDQRLSEAVGRAQEHLDHIQKTREGTTAVDMKIQLEAMEATHKAVAAHNMEMNRLSRSFIERGRVVPQHQRISTASDSPAILSHDYPLMVRSTR